MISVIHTDRLDISVTNLSTNMIADAAQAPLSVWMTDIMTWLFAPHRRLTSKQHFN
jgi:hypothetical protein